MQESKPIKIENNPGLKLEHYGKSAYMQKNIYNSFKVIFKMIQNAVESNLAVYK